MFFGLLVVGTVHDGQDLFAGETTAFEFVEPLEEKRGRSLLVQKIAAEERDVLGCELVRGVDSLQECTAAGEGIGDARHGFFSKSRIVRIAWSVGHAFIGQILKFQFLVVKS